MDLQKVKEALENNLEALCSLDKNQFGDVIIDGKPSHPVMVELVGKTREALAELEKPTSESAEELASWLKDAFSFGCTRLQASVKIQQYAESCHEKKCVHCQKIVYCELCGDPISVGVCENCVPEVITQKGSNV